jgi:hypothetical protein
MHKPPGWGKCLPGLRAFLIDTLDCLFFLGYSWGRIEKMAVLKALTLYILALLGGLHDRAGERIENLCKK